VNLENKHGENHPEKGVVLVGIVSQMYVKENVVHSLSNIWHKPFRILSLTHAQLPSFGISFGSPADQSS
jgi:hypothetical protein